MQAGALFCSYAFRCLEGSVVEGETVHVRFEVEFAFDEDGGVFALFAGQDDDAPQYAVVGCPGAVSLSLH